MTRSAGAAEVTDYILRITREIWEDGNPDKVLRYYAPEARIHALGGIMRGAAEVTANTRAMQAAFPDRLVIGEEVVCSPLDGGAWLSSHRIRSPMTSLGANAYGPATGERLTTHVFADCVVRDGMIHKEWLTRDNLDLVRQLDLDPLAVARREAAKTHPDEHLEWLAGERRRVIAGPKIKARHDAPAPQADPTKYAEVVLSGTLQDVSAVPAAAYAHYAVLSDSRTDIAGRQAILAHYAALRQAVRVLRLSVDHAAVEARGADGFTLAARWTAAAEHCGTFERLPASGAPLFVMGITHWWLTGSRIAREWTVFDRLSLMEQILRHGG